MLSVSLQPDAPIPKHVSPQQKNKKTKTKAAQRRAQHRAEQPPLESSSRSWQGIRWMQEERGQASLPGCPQIRCTGVQGHTGGGRAFISQG